MLMHVAHAYSYPSLIDRLLVYAAGNETPTAPHRTAPRLFV